MKNAFAHIGQTCVSMVVAAGLSAVAMFGATVNPVTINLPHAVSVGSATLPGGSYTMTGIEMADGDQLFVLRSEHGASVTLQARRVMGETAENTKVEFSTAGDTWHFQKLFIQGESTGYEFVGTKSSEKSDK